MNKFKKKLMINVKEPQNNFLGRFMLKNMNNYHSLMSVWGLHHASFARKNLILDIGCGGGKNLQRMLKISSSLNAVGIDLSAASVDFTKKKNRRAVKSRRLQVVQGQVESLPFASNLFDLETAFETIYFWDLEKGFSEVYRTLKKGGQFLIVNEARSEAGLKDYVDTIGFSVYDKHEIERALKNAGFKHIKIDCHENGNWICAVCEK